MIFSPEPPIPARFSKVKQDDGTEKSEDDPEYESKSLRYKMQSTMYTRNHDKWTGSVKNRTNNKSRKIVLLTST